MYGLHVSYHTSAVMHRASAFICIASTSMSLHPACPCITSFLVAILFLFQYLVSFCYASGCFQSYSTIKKKGGENSAHCLSSSPLSTQLVVRPFVFRHGRHHNDAHLFASVSRHVAYTHFLACQPRERMIYTSSPPVSLTSPLPIPPPCTLTPFPVAALPADRDRTACPCDLTSYHLA